MLNLRSVDLNLLPVFEAAYEERSLSRAAERLAMTQSAVSHALTRLRALFRDPLFVRQSRGVMPTPEADRLYAGVREALASVRDAVAERRRFDPRISERRFVVAIPHPLGPLIILRLQKSLGERAPRTVVAASTRSRPIDLSRELREGRADAAVDWLPTDGEPFRQKVLFEDALVAVARSGHPALRHPPSRKLLDEGAFVRLRPRIEGEHPLEGILAWQRLKLNYVLEVSELLEVFMVVKRSDLFGLIPRSTEAFGRAMFGLRPLRWAPKASSVPIRMIWHESRDQDPAQAFLRAQFAMAVAAVVRDG
jgi:DNA-binding transcriptional LysR family regulator